jgi:hypothetical protein
MPSTDLIYGVCVGDDAVFSAFAERSIRRSEPDAVILTRTGQQSIARAYNSILTEAREHNPGALVLLHEDVELRDQQLPSKLRRLFADETVAIAGAVGGWRVPSMAWWEGEELIGSAPDRFRSNTYPRRSGDVQQADGILLCFSPWAIQNLRFDEHFRGFHGYDADICRQALAADRRVVVTETTLFHHNRIGNGPESHQWLIALYRFRLKWQRGTTQQRIGWHLRRLKHVLLARAGHQRAPVAVLNRDLNAYASNE